MQKKYLGSVQVLYPRYNREEVIELMKERLDKLKRELLISLVVLFGSYAKEAYTAMSIKTSKIP